jgi:hypothetical protein
MHVLFRYFSPIEIQDGIWSSFFLSSPGQRPRELLPSGFVRRRLSLAFHILIFSSETTRPIATKLWWNGPMVAPLENCVRWSQTSNQDGHQAKNRKKGGSDTIFKGTHLRTIPARFGLIWFSSFREKDLNVIFYQNMPNLHNRYKSTERKISQKNPEHMLNEVWLCLDANTEFPQPENWYPFFVLKGVQIGVRITKETCA